MGLLKANVESVLLFTARPDRTGPTQFRAGESAMPGPNHRKQLQMAALGDVLTRGCRSAVAYGRRALGRTAAEPSAATESGDHSRRSSQVLVAGPGMRFYHRADCPMTAERKWPPASAVEHSHAGRTPCGMCTP